MPTGHSGAVRGRVAVTEALRRHGPGRETRFDLQCFAGHRICPSAPGFRRASTPATPVHEFIFWTILSVLGSRPTNEKRSRRSRGDNSHGRVRPTRHDTDDLATGECRRAGHLRGRLVGTNEAAETSMLSQPRLSAGLLPRAAFA
jgi:hypothetical protein